MNICFVWPVNFLLLTSCINWSRALRNSLSNTLFPNLMLFTNLMQSLHKCNICDACARVRCLGLSFDLFYRASSLIHWLQSPRVDSWKRTHFCISIIEPHVCLVSFSGDPPSPLLSGYQGWLFLFTVWGNQERDLSDNIAASLLCVLFCFLSRWQNRALAPEHAQVLPLCQKQSNILVWTEISL